MEVNNVSESYNPVFKRREISFSIDHTSQGSPKIVDIRKSLSEKYGTNEENIYVVEVKTKTGTNQSTGLAEIYESAETATKVVPKYVQRRNTPTRRSKQEGAAAPAPAKAPAKEQAKGEKK